MSLDDINPDDVESGVYVHLTFEDGEQLDDMSARHPAMIIRMAELVLAAYGDKWYGNARQYKDGTVCIRSNYNNLDLEITRQPMPAQGMPGSNPCIMVANGECIRTHGEQAYIVDHLVNMTCAIYKAERY